MRSLSMRSSLLASAAVALLVAMIVGAVGIQRTNTTAGRAEAIYREALLPLATLKDIQQLIWHARWASLSNLTATDPTKASAYGDEASTTYDLVSTRLDEYTGLSVTAAEQAAMATFRTTWSNYLDLRKQSSALKNAGKLDEWQQFRSTTLNPAIAQAIKDLDALVSESQRQASASAAAAKSAARQARLVIGGVLGAGVLVAAAFALLVARVLSRRLGALREVLAAMAAGDLTEREPDSATNEIGEMSRSVHRAAGQMRATIQTLAGMSTGLSERSTDLQRASHSLSGSTDQASSRVSSIEAAAGEVSAGVQAVAGGAEEMGAAIREIAISATDAAQVAANAVDVAAHAKQLMGKLDASSAEIDNVVKAITAIAEQTNLLALNATIEAARAGEAGKGFGVVAEEVKQLAQQTAQATGTIIERVQGISSGAAAAAAAIGQIGEIVGRINDIATSIGGAVEEQTATTAEISRSAGAVVHAANATTQVNTESANSARDLAAMATALESLVTQFQTDHRSPTDAKPAGASGQ